MCCPGFSYVQMRKEVEVKGAAFGRFDYGDSTFLSMSMSPSFDERYFYYYYYLLLLFIIIIIIIVIIIKLCTNEKGSGGEGGCFWEV